MSPKLRNPPTRIEEHDRVVMSLSAERAMRLQLQHEAAVKHANELGAARKAHGEKHTADVAKLRAKYALSETDGVDLDTGNITRAPKSTEAEKKEG